MAVHTETIVIWMGRLSQKSGYGQATRGYAKALLTTSIRTVFVDSQTFKIVGPSCGVRLEVSERDDRISIEAPEGVRVVLVLHDTPEMAQKLKVSGSCRSILMTVIEDSVVPARWFDGFFLFDEVWVPTEFNIGSITNSGFPRHRIFKIPHVVNDVFLSQDLSPTKLPDVNSCVLLSVVSNFNRKDVSELLTAYFEAFEAGDDVSLVVKIPSNTSLAKLEEFAFREQGLSFDLADDNNPHVVFLAGHLSTQGLAELYRASDAHISTERAKGWDLPSMEAMASGVLAVSTNWSGNTEFMKPEFTELIPTLKERDFALELCQNKTFYAGSIWPLTDRSKLVETMRSIYQGTVREGILPKARDHIIANYSPERIGQLFSERLDSFQDPDFRDTNSARIVWSEQIVRAKPKGKIVPFESLELPGRFIDPPSQSKPIETWVARRRSLYCDDHGMVLPPQREIERLTSLRNKFAGHRIFIIGNGPSLNPQDLALIKDEYSFAANRIYLMYDKTDWRPTFFTCLDWSVSSENQSEINQQSKSSQLRFFPQRFAGLFEEDESTFWYEAVGPGDDLRDKFSTDAPSGIIDGGTVLTAAMQLAYYMGFKEQYLIGVDVSYKIPDTVIQSGGDKFGTGVQINLESTKDDDANHFDPRYFGAGAKWHDPNTNEMIRGFNAARDIIELNGGKVRNATRGGNLNSIQRANLDDLFS